MDNLLNVKNLTKVFASHNSRTVAVNNVNLSLPADNPITLAIVGESGSGKSTLANLVLGFIRPSVGEILYREKNIGCLTHEEKKHYRREVQAIFQNPFDAYNPFYKIDHTFDQVFNHFDFDLTKNEKTKLICHKLEQVKLDPSQILGKYSYQLSGGQLQRVLVARALLLKPKLLIADEPVSMIDASLRVTVLDVMVKLKKEHKIAQMYITHDLSTALQISDEIIVMYKGHVVESGHAETVIMHPKHPYTQMLIKCIPMASPDEKWQNSIDESETNKHVGGENACCFCSRCPYATENCIRNKPELKEIEDGYSVSCHLYNNK